MTETVGALKYEISDKCISLGSTNLKDISDELKDILLKVNNIVTDIQQPREVRKPWILDADYYMFLLLLKVGSSLREARLQRAERREDIENQLKHNYQRVENSFAVKEEEIAELYSDLQFKLNIPK